MLGVSTGQVHCEQWPENGLYASPNNFRVIKLRRMRWEGHVAHLGEIRSAYNIFVGKCEGKRPL
jgi:hypothetical protein